jgi:hypothetical protein
VEQAKNIEAKQASKKDSEIIKLSDQLITSVDLGRTIRELEALHESLYQAALRQPGKSVHLAKSSRTLEELAALNGVSLLDQGHREQLLNLLKALSVHAPKIHISFAVEPTGVFLKKMVTWLRENIHPLLLMDVGLQPNLAAGCSIRTNNKIFDLSLRQRLFENRQKLIDGIRGSFGE